jgi:cytochrome c oxidase subunit 2
MKKDAQMFCLALSIFCCSTTIATAAEKVVEIKAKRYEFTPSEIVLKTGEPVKLRITTEDRVHGFNAPELKLDAQITPGKVSELELTPQKAGEYGFFCDVFCGSGHPEMTGKIIVKD